MATDTSTLSHGHRRLGFHRRRVSDVVEADAPLTTVAPAKPPRLLLRFGIYAGIALIAAAATGTWLASRNARARAERDVWRDAHYTAAQLGRDDLAKIALRRPVDATHRAELDELFGRVALQRGVVRVTLFGRSGIVTYSTDHTLIGKMPYDLPEVQQALQGAEVHGTSRLHGGVDDNPVVLHSYAPVYWYFDRNSSPNGVMGVYREYAPVAKAIRAETKVRAGVIIAALLILYIALFPILRRVMRTLESRNRQLVRQADALRESEEQYRLIVETAAEGVALLDGESNIVFTNQKLAELLGRSVDDLPGHSLVELMDEHSRAAADPRWFRRRHEDREFAFVLPTGGLVHTCMSVNPILDRDGGYSGALAMVMDITERKRAEEALHEIEGRLGESPVRRETQQAASIAREFDGTLTALTGYTDYLLNRLDQRDPLYREVTQLRRSAEGIAPVTRQLLAISRRESFQSGLVDLGAVLDDLAEQFPRLVGDGIQLQVEADRSLGRFEADPAQIEQVLVNLLLYASHSMHDRGRIEIEARNVDLDEAFTKEHFPMRPGPFVLLTVADDGPGLDDEQRAHLFSPLFAGKHEDAAGRGLATVYGIVKQSEGFVWADGAPGEGTTFRIYFPRVTEPLAA
ncbi:MAG TPA: PAS domain S-box protein [Gaiellaceae bacterium]|nr:PAS domain S-box protein [Gaiellaceae bacterium]